MTGPSAMGSLKGMPSSITSVPPASSASKRGTVDSRVGKPAVRKLTRTLWVSFDWGWRWFGYARLVLVVLVAKDSFQVFRHFEEVDG